MLQFPCNNCGMLLKVDDARRSDKTICANCNTRQIVPEDAMPSFDSPSISPNSPAPGTHTPKPPEYELVIIIGYIFIAIALIFAVVIVIMSMLHPPESLLMLTGLISPLILIAFVLLLFMIRDIAIHNWHIRHAIARS